MLVSSVGPVAIISIAGGPDIGPNLTKFEWISFVNGGYMIRAKVSDPFFNYLKSVAINGYLAEGREIETPVTFTLKQGNSGEQTKQRTAYMTDLQAHGVNEGGEIEFVAIDPPSFYLNEGTADGRVYTGRVSDVIKQVVKDFAPGIDVEVTKTTDNEKGKWWMMRQDPHTFIRSLLDFSASLTPQKTSWVVASVDKKIVIREQASLQGKDLGVYYVNRKHKGAADALQFDMLADNFVSPLQTKLITSGISAVSGEFLDKITDSQEQKVIVKDENTSAKANAKNLTPKQAFAKPHKKWATSVMAVPEHSAGDIGTQYSKYIDGRARGLFMNMLNLVMRVKLRITGEAQLDDSSLLGTSTATLTWQDIDGNPYFLSGRWLVYGFQHTMTKDMWYTDLYLARLDYDAAAKQI